MEIFPYVHVDDLELIGDNLHVAYTYHQCLCNLGSLMVSVAVPWGKCHSHIN